MTPFVGSQFLCFGKKKSHGKEGFFLHFSTSMVQRHNQLARYYYLSIYLYMCVILVSVNISESKYV